MAIIVFYNKAGLAQVFDEAEDRVKFPCQNQQSDITQQSTTGGFSYLSSKMIDVCYVSVT